ncbi:unnamed protein product [Spirodela intermedia]|uniref:Uncharacterized protein n=1 Tax=Spirodela intermedia TaxID=51605 RepID=A0A7I8IBC8_SPIIN|nr:unnamed protein product [Spirodela intermedia]CAA6654888.1 unnamed protein product [Spirodela intermedia]
MDFIIGLPRVGDLDTILVVVDRFSKYATFIPTCSECKAEEVADHDPHFTGRFWSALFTLLGIELKRVNGMLEDYLRHYVTTRQDNWVELLDAAQFAHNIQQCVSTRHSPCELVMRRYLLATYRFTKNRHDQLEEAREALARVAQQMNKNVDRYRREVEYDVGDWVLLRIYPTHKSL